MVRGGAALWLLQPLHYLTTCFKVQGLRDAWCFELQAVVGTDEQGPKLSQKGNEGTRP